MTNSLPKPHTVILCITTRRCPYSSAFKCHCCVSRPYSYSLWRTETGLQWQWRFGWGYIIKKTQIISAFVKTPLIRLSSKLHVVPAQSENMNMVHSWGPIVGTISTIYENVQLSVWDIDILPGTSGNKYVGRLIGRFSFSSYQGFVM